MKFIKKLKSNAYKLKKEIKTIYFAYQRKDIGILPKVIIFLTIGYALSPIDLIPDFIPILGYLDDLLILPFLISLSIKLIPKNVIEECRIKAENEKIDLKKNWFFGFLFISFWFFIIFLIIKKVILIFKK
jgi:uncharacterized membrane protein YkvA (DUF1232 family)